MRKGSAKGYEFYASDLKPKESAGLATLLFKELEDLSVDKFTPDVISTNFETNKHYEFFGYARSDEKIIFLDAVEKLTMTFILNFMNDSIPIFKSYYGDTRGKEITGAIICDANAGSDATAIAYAVRHHIRIIEIGKPEFLRFSDARTI